MTTTDQGRALIQGLSDDQLMVVLTNIWLSNGDINYDLPALKELANRFNPNTNLNWLVIEIGLEAYERDVLDEDDWNDIQEACC